MKLTLVYLILLFNLLMAGPQDAPVLSEPIAPLPAVNPNLDKDKLVLGERLFSDKRLSQNNQVSCASCHDLQRGGVDGTVRSIGVGGMMGEINAPTVFNSGYNFRQFWNGRAKTLEDQVDGPLEHPKELGSRWDDVVKKLNEDPEYPKLFKKIFKSGINAENIKDALATFERALITPNARFDRYLKGEKAAISELEKKGYEKFKAYGCVACHQGVNVGGNMFQTMGIMGNYFAERKTPITNADLGRFTVTKEESDRHVFKVPSLRNVEQTAPYFHDGSATTLEQAVNTMAKFQLGRKLSKDEVESIVAFLKTLTGEPPAILKQRVAQ